jgi:uncharacterized protein (TIGR02246 family)
MGLIAGVASLFAEDGDLVGFSGASSKGRAAIQETYVGALEDTYKGSSLKLARTGLHIVTPDVIVTDGTWEIVGGVNAEGAPSKGFYTFVMAKQGDDWTIVSSRLKVPPAN